MTKTEPTPTALESRNVQEVRHLAAEDRQRDYLFEMRRRRDMAEAMAKELDRSTLFSWLWAGLFGPIWAGFIGSARFAVAMLGVWLVWSTIVGAIAWATFVATLATGGAAAPLLGAVLIFGLLLVFVINACLAYDAHRDVALRRATALLP